MIISLSGAAGSGKSTVGERLAEELSWPRYYMGQMRRDAAKKRGMILSEYGLYYIDDEGIRTPIKIKSEEDVFKTLGMNYLTPEQRESFSTGKIKIDKI